MLCLLLPFHLVQGPTYKTIQPTYRLGFPSSMSIGQPKIDNSSLRQLPFPHNSWLYQVDIKTNWHSPLSLQKVLSSPLSLQTVGRHILLSRDLPAPISSMVNCNPQLDLKFHCTKLLYQHLNVNWVIPWKINLITRESWSWKFIPQMKLIRNSVNILKKPGRRNKEMELIAERWRTA